jgi:outer membrane lipoprotein carrier protein
MSNHPVKLIITLLLAGLFLMGWSEKWSGIKSEAARIKTVSARFIQNKHLKILSKPLKSEGRIYFEAPDSLRWEYTAPLQSILLSYQGATKRYFKNGEQFLPDAGGSVQAMHFVLFEIQRWLGGRFNENPDFKADLKGVGKIVLIPSTKGLKKMLQRIEIQLANHPGMIESVTIFEDEGSYTRLEFYDVELNSELEASIFQEIE